MKIPSYRRHKPSKQAAVTLYGKDFYLGKYGTADSYEAYKSLISEYLKSKGEKVPPELFLTAQRSSKNLTVVEAADRYLTWSQARHGTVEQAHVRGMLKCVVGLFENERAAAIGPVKLRDIRRAMITRDWSRKYVNDQIARVKRMYKWLAAEELIPSTAYQALNVVSGLRQGEDGARETLPVLLVKDTDIEATLPYLPEVVADMVRLQRLTGMRPAEVCMLRPCDLDRSSDVWLYHPASHKTQHRGKSRVISIGPRAQEVLLRYLARDAEAYCFQPRDSEAKRRKPGARSRGFVFGEKYDVVTYRRAIHRACDKAFPHSELGQINREEFTAAQLAEWQKWRREHQWSPNQLRHAAATEIRREFGLEAAQIVLGHAKADVTQIYAERNLKLATEVARRIG